MECYKVQESDLRVPLPLLYILPLLTLFSTYEKWQVYAMKQKCSSSDVFILSKEKREERREIHWIPG